MTTIAYHHESKTIALDSQYTKGDIISTLKGNKTRLVDGVLFVIAGSICDYDLLIDYYFGRNKTELLPECGAYAIENGVVYSCGVNGESIFWKEELTENDATGSGSLFALAAMDFGKSARDAVKYAMTRCIYTGGKIRVIKVK